MHAPELVVRMQILGMPYALIARSLGIGRETARGAPIYDARLVCRDKIWKGPGLHELPAHIAGQVSAAA